MKNKYKPPKLHFGVIGDPHDHNFFSCRFDLKALDYCANHLPNSGHEIEILILYKEKVRTVLLIHHHLSLHDSSIRKTKKEEKIHLHRSSTRY